jgi:hypothetical protein
VDIQDVISRLAAATDDELSAALSALQAQAVEAQAGTNELSEDSVTALEGIATAQEQVLAEQGRRIELSSRLQAARSALAANAPAGPTEVEPVEDETVEGEPTDEADSVTASGRAKLGSIGKHAPKGQSTANVDTITTTTRATASSANFALGQKLDWSDVTNALHERLSVLRSGVGNSGKQHVARMQFDYSPQRTLGMNDLHNREVLNRVTSPESLVAAGGFCAPAEVLYDIPTVGVTDRPVRDSAMARFGVDRGQITYRAPMDALTMTSGIGVWTADDDALVGVIETPTDAVDPTKTCFDVACPGMLDASVYSVYLCLQYPNWTSRFDPEWVDSTTRESLVTHARFAENRLLALMAAGSKILSQAAFVSGTRDILVAIDKAQAYYRNRHRFADETRLRLILPAWVRELFRADLTRGFSGDLDALAVADALIAGWFAARNVNITWHLDGNAGATVSGIAIPDQFYANASAGGVLPPFPDKVDALLYAEGDWLFLDGGTLDLGLVRDSGLNLKNRYQTFVETWEGVALRGVESLRLVLGVQPSGAVVGTIPPATAATPFTD